jgi:hypothetical protein
MGEAQAMGCSNHGSGALMTDREKPAPAASAGQEPKWVKEMHAHFDRTGSFRPTDVERVLGDQRKSVFISMPCQYAAENGVTRKKG